MSEPSTSAILAWAADVAGRAPAVWPAALTTKVAGLSGVELRALERDVRAALAEMPLPLRPADASATRRVLERLAAVAAERDGRPEAQLRLLLEDWRDQEASALPYLSCLLAHGRDAAAAAFARYALASEQCRDRDPIQALLDSIGSPPSGWHDAVVAFSRAPSLEAWDELMRFVPEDVHYQRKRNTVQALMRLGVDGDLLFRCATRGGATSDAIELVERGLVDPQTVVQRGDEGPQQALSHWLGLAARAALARGDRLGTVRLLREAIAEATHAQVAQLSIMSIRDEADDELHAMLDAAGIPR